MPTKNKKLTAEKKTSFGAIFNKFWPLIFFQDFSLDYGLEISNRKKLKHINIYPWPYLGVQNSSSIPSKQSFRQSQISNWGTQRPLSQETPLGQSSCFARASSCNIKYNLKFVVGFVSQSKFCISQKSTNSQFFYESLLKTPKLSF